MTMDFSFLLLGVWSLDQLVSHLFARAPGAQVHRTSEGNTILALGFAFVRTFHTQLPESTRRQDRGGGGAGGSQLHRSKAIAMKAIKSASTWDFKLVACPHILMQRFQSICTQREFPEKPCERVCCFELMFCKH